MELRKLMEQDKPQTKVVVEEEVETVNLPATKLAMLTSDAIHYAQLKEQEKIIQARQKMVRKQGLEDEVANFGIPNSDGHKVLSLGPTKVIHQRRVKLSYDEVATEQLLKEKKLWQTCTHEERRRVLDYDKVEQAYESGLLTPEEFDSIVSAQETWAFYVEVDEEFVPEYAELKAIRKEIEEEAKK